MSERPAFPFLTEVSFQPGDVVFAVDASSQVVFWSGEAEELFERAASEVLGQKLVAVCPGLATAGFEVSSVLSGREFAGGVRCRSKSGRELSLYLYASAGRDRSGAVRGVVFVGRDVSAFWQAEEAVRSSEELFRAVFEQASDPVCVADMDGRVLEVNQATCDVLGFSREELRGMSLIDIVPPADRPRLGVALAGLLRTGALSLSFEVLRKDGTALLGEVRARVISVGGERRILSVTRDVSERARAEAALRASEARYRAIFESASDAVFVESLDGRILEVNENACRLLGYSREEFAGLKVEALVPAEARAWLPRVSDELLRAGRFRAEAVNVHRSGRLVPVEVSLFLVEFAQGRAVVAVVRDISERKEAERVVREERDRARLYLAIAGVVVVALDRSGCVRLLNRRGCEVLGVSESGALGRSWFDTFVPERERAGVRAVFEGLLRGKVEPVEFYESSVLCRGGVERVVAWRSVVLRDESGAACGTLSSGEDITERRLVSKRLRESEE
jgi:PAS domain S-box-containing protein